jgi:hypothetical protein
MKQDLEAKDEMTFRYTLNIFLLSALVLATGCIEEGAGSTSPDATKYFTNKIQGSWALPCEDITSLGDANIFGQMRAYSFSGSTVTYTYRYYSEATCANLISKYDATYTYSVVDAIQPAGHKINLTLTDDSVITYTAPVTADYNSRGVCGLYSGWFAFNPRSITGLGCEMVAGVLIPYKVVDSKIFTILAVDATAVPPRLYVGDAATGSGDADATRPTGYAAPYSQE